MSDSLYNSLSKICISIDELQKEVQGLDYKTNTKRIGELNIIISKYNKISDYFSKYKKIQTVINNNDVLINNKNEKELSELAFEENKSLIKEAKTLEHNLKLLLCESDENDSKNVIVEIRGAAGGEEANLFASDLFKIYSRYCETNSWNIKMISKMETGNGGFSNLSFMITGESVYEKMKYESGVHRVQRVPFTESKGRVHTSTTSVAILPEMDNVDVDIKQSDLRIDTFRSSGAGGQHVNTTDSAVRITHIPTGVVAASQDGRSQHANKDQAMKMLYAKLYEHQEEEARKKHSDKRKSAIGKGDRSEKIRTYNYPQNRVTDHRINLSVSLEKVLAGDLNKIIDNLIIKSQEEKMTNIEEIKVK